MALRRHGAIVMNVRVVFPISRLANHVRLPTGLLMFARRGTGAWFYYDVGVVFS